MWSFKGLKGLVLVTIPVTASLVGLYHSYIVNLFDQDGFWASQELLNKYKEDNRKLKAYEEKITKEYRHRYQWIEKASQVVGGLENIDTISDYTLKIETPCSAGTGWFLDYELPEGNKKYPTKWFIATNAHIVNDFFFKSNPYEQNLPNPITYYKHSDKFVSELGDNLNCLQSKKTQYSNLKLFKQGFTVGEDTNGDALENLQNNGYDYNTYFGSYGRHDWENAIKALATGAPIKDTETKNTVIINRRSRRSPVYYYTYSNYRYPYIYRSVIKDPKLFYAPINFSGTRFNKNGYSKRYDHYYKDFVILEVDFPSESTARKITDNFYTKYSGSKKGKEINFFTKELMEENDGDQLVDSQENYFIAGFPANDLNSYKIFSNLNTRYRGASRLGTWSDQTSDLDDIAIRNKNGQRIVGHVDSGKIDYKFGNTGTLWNGRWHATWGYNYLLNNVTLHGGASGSLVLNSKKELLGIYRMHDAGNSVGFVEPLSSVGVVKDGEIILPKYDLLRGSPGQITSYKQQLETYHRNIKTNLKDNKKWGSEVASR